MNVGAFALVFLYFMLQEQLSCYRGLANICTTTKSSHHDSCALFEPVPLNDSRSVLPGVLPAQQSRTVLLGAVHQLLELARAI
jgi:hypothetical protein